MINHIDIRVKDLTRTKQFYSKVLAPLGYHLNFDSPYNISFTDEISTDPGGDIYFNVGEPTKYHFAFQAKSHEQVQQFYTAAMEMGATDNGAPGYRPHYHAHYYACYVIDLDGYPIECVCHKKVELPD